MVEVKFHYKNEFLWPPTPCSVSLSELDRQYAKKSFCYITVHSMKLNMVSAKVYIPTGIPTRIVGTCFCGENLGSAGNLSICVNFKVFSFVMTCNNKKDGAIFGGHITVCAITQCL